MTPFDPVARKTYYAALSDRPMESLAALLLLLVGIPHAVWPYEAAKLREQIDSIGSRRSRSEGEPKEWAATVNRVLGVGSALVGVAILVTS